ncbi:hypothetical protein LTR03_009421 [Friedmanniomyces endolithicus]|nr:hypothetical protein LTR03_009421 [Friedmanniomyces endolithicus]
MPATSKKRQATEQDSDTPAAKRTSARYVDLITILAGADKSPFVVHKYALCNKSKFFAAACKREWKEGVEKTICVPSITPEIFELYVHWVYSGKIDLSLLPLVSPRAGNSRSDDVEGGAQDVQYLIELYVAGDTFMDEPVQNKVIDRLAAKMECWLEGGGMCIQPGHIEYLWSRTSPDSAIRDLFLDSIASTMVKDQLQPFRAMKGAQDFWYGLAEHQLERGDLCVEDFAPTWERRCVYHVHRSDEERRACEQRD